MKLPLSKKPFSFKLLLTLAIPVFIVLDFVLPGNSQTMQLVSKIVDTQSHNNASGNVHYSYQIGTVDGAYYVEENLFKNTKEGEEIVIKKSLLFDEANRIQLVGLEKAGGIHSLRWFSGLVLPLSIILTLLFLIIKKKQEPILTVILLVIGFADLAFIAI